MKIYSVKNKLLKEMFIPQILGLFINPFYIIRRWLYKWIKINSQYMNWKMLDFGCGKKPYRELFVVKEYIGLDILESWHNHKNEQIDVYYDGKKIPFENESFDSIFSSEVFEHIFNIEEILSELYRVMKPDGKMLITVPFVWDEHEIPYDFARYTSFGIRYLLEKADFKIIKIEKTTNYVETIFQMWNAYVYQYVFPRNIIIKSLLIPFFITPVTILGIVIAKIMPKNKNYYHNNVVVATKR